MIQLLSGARSINRERSICILMSSLLKFNGRCMPYLQYEIHHFVT